MSVLYRSSSFARYSLTEILSQFRIFFFFATLLCRWQFAESINTYIKYEQY